MKDFYTNNDNDFREKITSHEFKFDPSAWDKMEKMLDDEDPRKGVAWRYPYMMMLLGVLFLGFTFMDAPTIVQDQVVAKNSVITTSTPIIDDTNSKTNAVVEPVIITSSIAKTAVTTPNETKSVIVNAQSTNTTSISEKAIIEKTNSNNINTKQTILTTSLLNSKTTKVEAVKSYIQTIPTTLKKVEKQKERDNIQAFIDINTLLEPIEYEETIAAFPLERPKISLKKKRVKAGIQVGTSVVIAKNSIVDQGKLATTIGGFVDFKLDAKNTITVEANYKNGYAKNTILTPANARSLDMDLIEVNEMNPDGTLVFDLYAKNNIQRVHAVELPVTYKRKIGKRNAIFAGIKTSLLKFKNSSETNGSAFADARTVGGDIEVDLGLVAGVEHRINKNISVDVRYNQGLKDLNTTEVSNTNSDVALTMKYAF